MKKEIIKLAVFSAAIIAAMNSCSKDSIQPKTELFDADFKNIELNTGVTDNGIPIKANTWSIQYVKDGISGEILESKEGTPVVLDGFGSVELPSGWLKLEKKKEDNLLTINLKENLTANPRSFLIGILADGKQDEMSFTQTRGEGYEIVKKEITEVAGSRAEYTSDEGCYAITLSNNSSAAKNMETTDIFKDVKYMSEFSSEDVNAFDWVNPQDTLIFMDEIMKDGAIWWSGQDYYKKGKTFEPDIKADKKGELLVQPHSSINVHGKMVYLERECIYTFTIKNLSSGHTCDVSGTWKQKTPISSITEIY